MKRKPHGNSHQNKKLHHLYKIDDQIEKEVYKFGISQDKIEEDGLSKRLRKQISLFNLVANATRFVGQIIMKNIEGRKVAEKIEKDFVENHEKKYGRKPRGNQN